MPFAPDVLVGHWCRFFWRASPTLLERRRKRNAVRVRRHGGAVDDAGVSRHVHPFESRVVDDVHDAWVDGADGDPAAAWAGVGFASGAHRDSVASNVAVVSVDVRGDRASRAIAQNIVTPMRFIRGSAPRSRYKIHASPAQTRHHHRASRSRRNCHNWERCTVDLAHRKRRSTAQHLLAT